MADNTEQERLGRCAAIASQLLDRWQATGRMDYTVRATEAVGGLELAELLRRPFAVGVGDDLTVLPLADVLFVFSLIEKRAAAIAPLRNQPPVDYSVQVHMPGELSRAEAVRLLSQLRIETPLDRGEVLAVALGPRPQDSGTQE
jgi:hypothetical protein